MPALNSTRFLSWFFFFFLVKRGCRWPSAHAGELFSSRMSDKEFLDGDRSPPSSPLLSEDLDGLSFFSSSPRQQRHHLQEGNPMGLMPDTPPSPPMPYENLFPHWIVPFPLRPLHSAIMCQKETALVCKTRLCKRPNDPPRRIEVM